MCGGSAAAVMMALVLLFHARSRSSWAGPD
jgi:hypothetical protein